ncbi:trans-sialidase [Trypanosoma rangeli]|uniref:Trans-sialidase n=1 Tax=Trypanosoma rangeli TaxID=5698 RepID=A0A422MWY1_TRYRA|nr:trans-sialidase [Trypanosoma rangeli]RNE97671.1 trans-sialidase [Trypanosoma rangeli]|eukprot:RNE97671.1 trans-sialidase [Trypanosoma rangeli]
MPKQLFSFAGLLLCVLLMCCGSGAAAGDQKNVVDPFTGTAIVSGAEWEDVTNGGASVKSLRVPSLVEVDGAVFAVAEAQCKNGNGSFTGIVSRHLKGIGSKPTEIPMGAGTGSFHTQLLKEGDNGMKDTARPTTLVSGNNVYVLLGSCSRATPESKEADRSSCKLLLVKGSVTESGEKKVRWSEPHTVEFELGLFVKSLTHLSAVGGSGAVMSDGALVFPVQATKNGKKVLLAARFSPSENKWGPLDDTVGEGCHNPSIVEWGEGMYRHLLMMAPCTDGSYYVYESFISLRAWRALKAPISRLWGNSRDRKGEGVRSGFVTADIDGETVMLLTTPVYSEKGEGRLHLWVTDNARVHDVGPVSSETDDAAASSLLYRSGKKELILLYEKKKSGDSYGLVTVNLTGTLKQIKSVVKAWKDTDTALKNCASTGTVDSRIKNVCKGPIPTEGLIGFWSNSLEGNLWKDEYLGVNATVHGGSVAGTERVVRFRGAGSGAEWPVGKLGQNQPYHFVNSEFTLVATVMIDAVPEADGLAPLMGVRMNDDASTVLVGLFHTKERKWGVIVNGKPRGLLDEAGTWRPGTTYQVILQKDGDEVYVYVDGRAIYDSEGDEKGTVSDEVKRLLESHTISHFHLGGNVTADGTTTSHHVTVASVLLYNKALLVGDEVRRLKANTVPLPWLGATTPVIIPKVPPTSDGDGEENALVTKPASAGDNATEEQMPNPEAAVGSGSSPAPRGDAEQTPAEETRDTFSSGTVQTPFGNNEGVSQGADNAPVNKTASPEPQAIPPPSDAAPLSGNSSVNLRNITGMESDEGNSDGTVRGCVPRLLLLALLGLCGATALFV